MTGPPAPQDPYRPHDPDQPAPTEAELTEAEDRALTALLAAEGREPVTTPAPVVARLDDVLAGLVAERGHPSDASPEAAAVVPLAGRRGRRRWPQVLLAAAAVVVGGDAVGDLALDGPLSGGASDGADSSAAGGSAESAAEGQLDSETQDGDVAGGGSMSVVPTVRPDHLAADVRRVVRLLGQRPVVGNEARPSESPSDDGSGGSDGGGTVGEVRDCPVPRLTEGQRLYEVRFRGAPAGLVLGAPEAGSVDVTVYACSDGGVRLNRSVPAP